MNDLKILYEDNHIIVALKPVNILSQGDNTGDIDMLTLIKEYLKKKYHKPGNVYLGLVHRLDRVVGGIMVFAKTSKAASRLSNEIRLNNFSKIYLAVIHGNIEEKNKLIDYLLKQDNFSTVVTTKEKGRYAELSYDKIAYNEKMDLSLIKIFLKTGRHHQIRVQFSSRGYPLFGDNRYGNKKEKPIGLFASELSFVHPVTKEKMTFSVNPSDKPFNYFNKKNNY